MMWYMSVNSCSPAASYLTKNNILHPRSEGQRTVGAAEILAQAAEARVEIASRLGVTSVTGGTIQSGKD